MYYVYILLCSDGKHYSGLTKNIKVRLQNHSQGLSFSTKYRLPIKLLWVGIFRSRDLAVYFEKYLKSGSGKASFRRHLV